MSSTNKHIAKIDKRIADIKTQMVGVTGANVLVVEGVDDIAAFRILLDRSCPGWEQNCCSNGVWPAPTGKTKLP